MRHLASAFVFALGALVVSAGPASAQSPAPARPALSGFYGLTEEHRITILVLDTLASLVHAFTSETVLLL